MPISRTGHTYYTKEQYERAKTESALEYARRAGYNLIRDGRTYTLREHDSMVFTEDGRWYWNSRDLHGRALAFIMAYEGRTLPEAVNLLAEANRARPVHPSNQNHIQPPEEKKPFQLPDRSDNMKRLFAYLCGTRELDREVVDQLVHDGRLYEGLYRGKDSNDQPVEYHNAVFLGLDEDGTPKSAFQRGLSSWHPFKREVSGSQKEVAFTIPGKPGTDTVYVFEGAIDAMSHASLCKKRGIDWNTAERISLGGLSAQPLLRHLQRHPEIRQIGLALDTDPAGQKGVEQLKQRLAENGYTEENGYTVFTADCKSLLGIQLDGKDWNDFLRNWTGEERDKYRRVSHSTLAPHIWNKDEEELEEDEELER